MFRLKFIQLVILSFCASCIADEDRYLFLPVPEKCKNRFHESEYEGVNFFYSGHVPELKDLKVDWLDARNTCRERCMETVSFNEEKKFDFFKKYIEKNNITFFWSSGRLCDFAGCEGRWDLLPKIIKAWLWTGIQVQLDPTNVKPKDWSYQPWSHTGHRKLPQPDDAEFFINQVHESCLAILNNMYNDSVAFHDVACHHKTRFICEDSEPLLQQAKEIEMEQLRKIEEDKTSSTTTTQVTTTTEKLSTTKKINPTTKKSIESKSTFNKNITQKTEPTKSTTKSTTKASKTTTSTQTTTTLKAEIEEITEDNLENITELAEASEIETTMETFTTTASTTTSTTTAKTTKLNSRRNPNRRRNYTRKPVEDLEKESTTKKPADDTKKNFLSRRRNNLNKSDIIKESKETTTTVSTTTSTLKAEENYETSTDQNKDIDVEVETTTEQVKKPARRLLGRAKAKLVEN